MSKDDGVYLDDANLDPLIDLLEELDLDTPDPNETSARSKRPSDSPPDDYEIKLPLPGDIKRVGNTIFCGAQKTGSVSYLVHWVPAAIAVKCFIHDNCFITAPLLNVNEDPLVTWVGEAPAYLSGEVHGKHVPKGCYHRRNPPRRSGA